MSDNYNIYGKYGCWWEGGTGVSPDGHQCGECYPDYEDECPHLEKWRERECRMKVTKCTGEGHGSCKRCSDNGKWNRAWMCFLYEIEGFEGCYCRDCVKEIQKEKGGAE